MRIAAIDCGSNSFHLLIADCYGLDQIAVVEDDKSLLYLGAEVASTGKISSSTLTRAKRVIRHYKDLINRHEVDMVRSVATSAIRSAENGSEVIASLSKTLGSEIRVISGEEEAQVIFRGISALSSLPETRILACDMGGGSLELMAGQRHGLEYATSVPLGASRVARELKISDPITKENTQAIKLKCQKLFSDFSKQYDRHSFSNIVASSGTLTTLISMARASVDGYVSPPMTIISASEQEIVDLCNSLIDSKSKKREKLLGYDKARDEYIQTAAVIALEITKLCSPGANWTISPYALREGLVLTCADKHIGESVDEITTANKTIEDLAERIQLIHNANRSNQLGENTSKVISHGLKVKEIALKIFDDLEPIHKLGIRERRLLGYASQIHDLGETISHSKHDQHGAYILANIALPGLSPSQAGILRGTVRWHRSRDPRANEQYVGNLNEPDLKIATWLSAILRLADGADAGKSNALEKIETKINPDVIYFRFSSGQDCELELYSARRKRHLLEKITGRDIVIEPARFID